MTTPAPVTEHTIRRDLRAIIDLWPGLHTQAKDTTAGTAGIHRTPISAGALTLLREIPEILTAWAHVAMDDYGADPTGIDTTDAVALARWLLAFTRLMATHEAADDYGRELAESVSRIDRCVAGAKMHRQDLGPCPEKIETAGGARTLCPGELTAYVRLDGEEESVVRCSVVRDHSWTAAEWGDLSRRVNPGGRALVKVSEASALAGVPTSTIRRWASEGRLVRFETSDHRTYRVDFAQVEIVRDRLSRIPA